MKEVQDVTSFLEDVLSFNIDLMGTGFMMRSKDYDAIGGIPDYPDLIFADTNLWLQLTDMSYKATSQNECFSYRTHQSVSKTSIKSINAFHRFVKYLYDLKQKDESVKQLLQKHAKCYVDYYCKGLSHRLLRIKYQDRDFLNVKDYVKQCSRNAVMLLDNNSYDPYANKEIAIARLIDTNFITRNIFYRLRKLYNKPFVSK
jgi:hypothetical protein